MSSGNLYLVHQSLMHCVLMVIQVAPRSRSAPPIVFHWLPFIGSAIAYGNDPLEFFFKCREKVLETT
jgi:sterol 14-demethylase